MTHTEVLVIGAGPAGIAAATAAAENGRRVIVLMRPRRCTTDFCAPSLNWNCRSRFSNWTLMFAMTEDAVTRT